MNIATLAEAGDEEVRLAAEAADGESEFPAKFIEILTATVLEFDPLEQVPDALIGVEVRGVGRQPFQVQARGRARREEILHRSAVMNRRAVPDHQQLAPNLAEELTEEGDDRRPTERLPLHVGKQPPVRGDGADRGKVVTRKRRPQDRGLPDGRVGAGDEGHQVEGRFIYEEDGAVFLAGFA